MILLFSYSIGTLINYISKIEDMITLGSCISEAIKL